MLLSIMYCVQVAVYCIHAGTVLQKLTANTEYSIFLKWLSTDTKSNLNGTSVLLTVFVPTNEAIEKFLKEHPIQADNIHSLRGIAEHSVAHGNWDLVYLKEEECVVTGEDLPKLWLNVKNESTYINNAEVTSSLAASNGHVHELDAVIYPLGQSSTLKEEIGFGEDYSGLNSLLAKVTEAGDLLDDATAKFTVFSPNPKAVTDDIKTMNLAQLLPVIRRHLITSRVVFSTMLLGQRDPLRTLEQGASIKVEVIDNNTYVGSGGYWSMVESVDVSTSNGVIHVINGVLGATSGVNVVQALCLFDCITFGRTLMTSDFTALKNDLMDNAKIYTVFSPQDTAWDYVSTSNITKMKRILKRHVLNGKLTEDELMKKTEVMTMSGEKIAVMTENGRIYLEFDNVKAAVTSTDHKASNGIIHIIDQVLILTDSSSVDTTSISKTDEIDSSSDSSSLLPVKVGVGVGVSVPVVLLVIIVLIVIKRKRMSRSSGRRQVEIPMSNGEADTLNT